VGNRNRARLWVVSSAESGGYGKESGGGGIKKDSLKNARGREAGGGGWEADRR